jgi:hypothetical protein
MPTQVVVVVDRIVLCDPVVEQQQLVLRPAPPQHVFALRDAGPQQPQDVTGLVLRQSDDPSGEAAEEQAALTVPLSNSAEGSTPSTSAPISEATLEINEGISYPGDSLSREVDGIRAARSQKPVPFRSS